jgi:U3 small nucleolar ribonucleoprotein protein LCP5
MVTNVTNEDVMAADLPQFHNMMNNLKTYVTESVTGITNLHNVITEGSRNRENGLSFLEMKCHLFLEYLINITYSMLLKLDGKPISGEACIEHLVEIRTVLSKIKPIEKKLKYQIDKLVKMSSGDGKSSEQHALSFRPNIQNLVGKDEESEDEHDEDEEKTGVYVPPKLTAVPYEGDKLSREERKLEKARKRNLNSNLLADIREEFGDEPEEISDSRNRSMQRKLKEREDERERYEEDNLCRLTVTKKDKLMKRKLSMLDEVVKIGKYTGGDDDDSDDEADFEPKMKKGKKFGGGKGKFKKRMQRKRK